MRRFRRRCVVLVVSGLVGGIVPASAQFGGIFGEPPRPPANVPSPPADDRFPDQRRPQRQQNPAPAPQQYPDPAPPQYPAPSPQSYPGSGPSTAPIQSQTLPPPPGEPGAGPAIPGQRQQRGTPLPANTSPQPGDEVVTAPPTQKIINPTAVFSGLDKITGRITSFDVAINETVQFGALQVTPRVCYTRPPTETPNTDAFIEVDEVTLQGEVKRVFTGWMFAASPGLHGVEHPIYDVWLTDCKGGASTAPVAEAQTPAPARPAPAPRPQRPLPPPAQPRPPGPPR
jgi:hypothetical protein